MTKLEEAQLESIKLYLSLQDLEVTRQTIGMQIAKVQKRLVELDGIIQALTPTSTVPFERKP